MKQNETAITAKNIQNIRKHIEQGDLSFIVGAGFSKNVSQKFPFWGELLHDMVKELYPQATSPERIKQIIDEKGYLAVAEEYVKRNGFHEAIDIYIENHTPYLKTTDDGRGHKLYLNEQCIDPNPDLECHKRLMALGVKNIYTFNYDNCLDIAGETHIAENAYNEEIIAQNRKAELKEQFDQYKKESQELREVISAQQGQHEKQNIDKERPVNEKEHNSGNTIAYHIDNLNNIVEKIPLQLESFSQNCNIEQRIKEHTALIEEEISNNELKADEAAEQRSDKYQLITNSYQISLTENCKNIYKLHGSLRSNSNEKFGFDNESHKHYIITESDYKEYPVKHEAFVNLMKISLLKGAFCVIGFSGNDPNFLVWIDWVKEVLDRERGLNSKYIERRANNPIFFINVDNNTLDSAKLQLLKNHYITPVELSVVYPECKTPKERILNLFKSIETDNQKYDRYNLAWRDLDTRNWSSKECDIHSQRSIIQNIYSLTPYNRIPSQTGIIQHYRSDIFSYIGTALKRDKSLKRREAEEEKECWAKLIYSSLKGELMPIDTIMSHAEIKQLLYGTSTDIQEQFTELQHRSFVLEVPSLALKQENLTPLHKVWANLITLNFTQAMTTLKEWKPENKNGIENSQRIMLNSIFPDGRPSNTEFKNAINKEHYPTLQDYKYALETLPQIRGIIFQDRVGGMNSDQDIATKKRWLEQHAPKLNSLYKTIDFLIQETQEKRDTQPFGNAHRTIHFSKFNRPLISAIKLLQIFIELGIPTKAHYISLLNKERWVAICEQIYDRYPQTALYFTLLYGNEKAMVKKIAQLFTYNHALKSIVPVMLKQMLTALLDKNTPHSVVDAIYIAAPIFMKGISPAKWQELFIECYNKIIKEGFSQYDRATEKDDFICTGIELCSDNNFKARVIKHCLSQGSNSSYLHNSLLIAASPKIKEIDNETLELLERLLKERANTPQLFMLLNMKRFVDSNKLCHKLLSLADLEYKELGLLYGAARFAKHHPELQRRLSELAVKSPKLWLTGINDKEGTVSHYGYTLEVCQLQKNIKFSDSQIVEIYRKMEPAMKGVQRNIQNDRSHLFIQLSDWHYILFEMYHFVKNNSKILMSEASFTTTFETISRLYFENMGGNDLANQLIQDKNTGKIITHLTTNINAENIEEYKYIYIVMASKILTKSSEQLNSCIIHFAWVMEKFRKQIDHTTFAPLIRSIVKVYSPYYEKARAKTWDIQHADKQSIAPSLHKLRRLG